MTEMPSSHHITGWGRPCISNYGSAPNVGKHKQCTEQRFCNLGTINTLLYRSVLHIILCLVVALASSHQMPAVPPRCDNPNVSRHGQMCLGEGQSQSPTIEEPLKMTGPLVVYTCGGLQWSNMRSQKIITESQY